jgi:hypothetical protein
MLLNAADSAVTLNVRPCGIAVNTLLQLRALTPDQDCATQPRQIAPGDSIWAEYAAVVAAAGRGDVEVRYAAHPVETNPRAAMGAFSVVVLPTAARSAEAAAMVPRVLYAVRSNVAPEFLGVSATDVRNVVRHAIMTRSLAAVEFEPQTATRVGISHLLIELDVDQRGVYSFRSHWLLRGALAGGSPCATNITGSDLNAMTFGTTLATFVGSVLDRMKQGCDR